MMTHVGGERKDIGRLSLTQDPSNHAGRSDYRIGPWALGEIRSQRQVRDTYCRTWAHRVSVWGVVGGEEAPRHEVSIGPPQT
jgi:hypothetical protein